MTTEKLYFCINFYVLSLGTVIIDYSRDVTKMMGQRAVLYCEVNCSHKMEWITNFEEYRRQNLMTITNETVGLTRIRVKEIPAVECPTHKQSFEILNVTAEWHKISIQCVAISLDVSDNVLVYSRFATVYVQGK